MHSGGGPRHCQFRKLAVRKITERYNRKSFARSAFYIFFLHEQFHHKVESFGLRLLVATGTDRYRPYKKTFIEVFGTSGCLERALLMQRVIVV